MPFLAVIALSLAFQDAGGLPPHDPVSWYQAHRETEEATIAASMISPAKAAKLFTSEVSDKYLVVEIAVYPKPGRDIEIHSLDFALKNDSGGKVHPANPADVAAVWGQKKPDLPNRARVITEGSPAYGNAVNPATGRLEREWDTSAASGVGNTSPIYGTGPDSRDLSAKLKYFELPKGRTNRPVAGYLYFPVVKRTKKDAPEVEYKSITLPLHP